MSFGLDFWFDSVCSVWNLAVCFPQFVLESDLLQLQLLIWFVLV